MASRVSKRPIQRMVEKLGESRAVVGIINWSRMKKKKARLPRKSKWAKAKPARVMVTSCTPRIMVDDHNGVDII